MEIVENTTSVRKLDESSLPYKLVLSCPSGLSLSQVSVNFGESSDRIPHPSNDLESSIDQIWEQRVQENGSLYNGQKFRISRGSCQVPNFYRVLLAAFLLSKWWESVRSWGLDLLPLYGGCVVHTDEGTSYVSRVCLYLGLTDYRTFVGTNLSPMWESFLVPSEDDSIRCQHTSSPLGNGAILETSDKKIVVLRRSDNVGEFPGYYVFPGGHPEPNKVCIASHQFCEDATNLEPLNKKVSQEIFDSIICEVVEETGVPASSLNIPLFIGIARRELNVRPAAFFYIKCSLHSEQVQKLYPCAEDGFESTQLYTVSVVELEKMTSRMPGCHHGGFPLYKLMIEALNN